MISDWGYVGLWLAGCPADDLLAMTRRVADAHGPDAVAEILAALTPLLAERYARASALRMGVPS